MEKKLTDEEIVKALERCSEHDNCFDCPIMEEIKRRNCVCREIVLGVIHRLQREKKYKTECYDELCDRNNDMACEIANQKAEIERLANANMQTIGKNAELLLKVDELKEQNAQLSEMADYDKGHKEGYEHGAKTTAKEILTDAKKWVKEHYKDTVTDSFGKRPMLFIEAFGCLLAYLKDKHGVEVE